MWNMRLKTRKLVGSAGVIEFSAHGASIWTVAGRKDVRVPEEHSGQWKRFSGRKIMFN